MWITENNELKKKFVFKNFKEAFGFMTAVAEEAEKANHHPDWRNVYNSVEITLSTHDAGNIVTSKDIELSQKIDEIAAGIGR
jgi:4a-hydroxytetrahydrobiopterin dehydratase